MDVIEKEETQIFLNQRDRRREMQRASKHFMRFLSIAAAALFLSAIQAGAEVIRVDGAGGGDYMTINEALAVARPGDVIQVAKGTYFETISLIDGVVLEGGYESEGWTRDIDANPTIIDGNPEKAPPVSADGVNDAVLDGFIIVNWDDYAVNLVDSSVIITSNTMQSPGSNSSEAVYSLNSQSVIAFNTINGAGTYNLETGMMIIAAGEPNDQSPYAPYIIDNNLYNIYQGVYVFDVIGNQMLIEGNWISSDDYGINMINWH